MLDAANFDPRPLRVRLLEALPVDGWMTGQELAAKLGDPHYTVLSMISKIYMYGGPVERMKPDGGGAYRYRRKLKKDHV